MYIVNLGTTHTPHSHHVITLLFGGKLHMAPLNKDNIHVRLLHIGGRHWDANGFGGTESRRHWNRNR